MVSAGYKVVHCERCGQYNLGLLAEALLDAEPEANVRLSRYVYDCNRLGEHPDIFDIKKFYDLRPLKFTEKANRLLSYWVEKNNWVDWLGTEDPHALALTESRDSNELYQVASYLQEQGYVYSSSGNGGIFRPKGKGYERYEELNAKGGDSSQAFVAMWFDTSMKEPYENGLSAGIIDAGYVPMRIDQHHTSNKIDDEIIAQIRKSRFLVADYTCGTTTDGSHSVRGGVYFETGFAFGLGIPVIWSVRKDCLPALHFDTRQFAHILWEKPDDLRSQLRARIEALIGVGPKASKVGL